MPPQMRVRRWDGRCLQSMRPWQPAPPDRYLVAYYLEAMDLGQRPLLEPAISLLLSIRRTATSYELRSARWSPPTHKISGLCRILTSPAAINIRPLQATDIDNGNS